MKQILLLLFLIGVHTLGSCKQEQQQEQQKRVRRQFPHEIRKQYEPPKLPPSMFYFTNYNEINTADADSYSTALFSYLYGYLNDIKRQKCGNIPFPKTVLNQKYFNPMYELQQTKSWYPPKEHNYVVVWSQYESYRNALFLSYLLQNENAKNPPGWLYLYLSTAAQLHSLQMIGYNSHKIIKSIKLPFESNEVFKVDWYTSGNYQKFDKPFALYATKPRYNDQKFVKVTDFGVGNYTSDYTGHAFLGSYAYQQQQEYLNGSFIFSNNWERPAQTATVKNLDINEQIRQQSLQQRKEGTISDYQNMITDYSLVNPGIIPLRDWDPLIDNENTYFNNRLQETDVKYGFDNWYYATISRNNELYRQRYAQYYNPFALPNVQYIESYKLAKPWWRNESYFTQNQQDYLFRIKPDERNYKFMGPKYELGYYWTPPYFWCPDPTSWLVTVMTPIWADNDYYYKNRIFLTYDRLRFVGLSEVVLNYEEADINQCPGDRQLSVFSSTALCDSTTQCIPLPGYGLAPGGYDCYCSNGFRYPDNFDGPFRGHELTESTQRVYPLCIKSESLLQYPNWIVKNPTQLVPPSRYDGTNDIRYRPFNDYNYNYYGNIKNDQLIVDLKDEIKTETITDTSSDNDDEFKNMDHLVFPYKEPTENRSYRRKRFIDRRNNFEKLRDSIFSYTDHYRERCYRQYLDVMKLFEDDERFVQNLRFHVNEVFKPQMAQAVRIAHILSAYIQLHIPFGTTNYAGNQYDSFNTFSNTVGNNMRQDPQLEEHIVIAEIMSTIYAHFPLVEVNVFFNGTEYRRQKLYASQNTLAFGLSMIRTDYEVTLNRSNDDSHLTKTWYKDAISKYVYAGKTSYGDNLQPNNPNLNSFESELLVYKFERYAIEMDVRKTFDGFSGTTTLPIKFYEAASSGVWYGPFYDCQKKFVKPESTLRLTYSVPIVVSSSKPPLGFVSITVGSNLKWWRINPCDTSRDRNMFQSLHKCDAESTVCVYQDVPEYESGYYLASYKCVCRANYEFPYIDSVTNYFEGGMMEKEYDKKIKGQSNIFDRLKCRPVIKGRNTYGNFYNNAQFVHTFNKFSILITFAIFILNK